MILGGVHTVPTPTDSNSSSLQRPLYELRRRDAAVGNHRAIRSSAGRVLIPGCVRRRAGPRHQCGPRSSYAAGPVSRCLHDRGRPARRPDSSRADSVLRCVCGVGDRDARRGGSSAAGRPAGGDQSLAQLARWQGRGVSDDREAVLVQLARLLAGRPGAARSQRELRRRHRGADVRHPGRRCAQPPEPEPAGPCSDQPPDQGGLRALRS